MKLIAALQKLVNAFAHWAVRYKRKTDHPPVSVNPQEGLGGNDVCHRSQLRARW
jgi:hypothetical protein